jgi:excisionase family DNA binding protein
MSEKSFSDPVKPRWFSIKEAAEHLEVGEPTLYRWMREGKITYRKVGDSTRFWQEDLDAVMEVFHSEKNMEEVKKICPVCHTGRLAEGALRSTGLNYFQPRKTKFWTLKDSQVSTQAYMCERCGAIHLFGDVGKLAGLRAQISNSGGRSAATP